MNIIYEYLNVNMNMLYDYVNVNVNIYYCVLPCMCMTTDMYTHAFKLFNM